MEEINLNELLNYFWTKKILIIVCFIVSLYGGIMYSTVFQKPMYKSYTTLLLTPENKESTITNSDITLNRNLVDTYREIIKSKKILNTVIENLDLDYTYSMINRHVSVESVNETEIIKISVTDENKWLAMYIANEIATVFKTEVVKIYKLENIAIIDTAELSNSPYNINTAKQVLISGVLGLAVGFGIAFVIYYFDTTIKSAEDIEKKIGLPVIGSIPETGGKNNE